MQRLSATSTLIDALGLLARASRLLAMRVTDAVSQCCLAFLLPAPVFFSSSPTSRRAQPRSRAAPRAPQFEQLDDVVFFECFSADESTYGCLNVNRDDGFGKSDQTQLGTTNVDYSWDLYNHFQSLRSYRPTRFRLDPDGFQVRTRHAEQCHEEKVC